MSKMYTCNKCGKPTPNFVPWTHGPVAGTLGYSICGNCRNAEKRKRAWENEQWRKSEITCPWCGYSDPDSWEFDSEYDDEYECSHCGKPFIAKRIVDVTYTSKRRIEDMPERWISNND